MTNENPPKDHTAGPYERRPPSALERNLSSGATWLRLLFMLVVVLLWVVSRIVILAVVLLQFFHVLFTGEVNDKLKDLGEQLARYSYQIVAYLTYNTEHRPFPFDLDWPSTRTVAREDEGAP
ncbi:MAG TPA: DUF4389 domain-containing protein [Gammaproteobacteria bacterium]|jgi:hypothetical protein